MITITDKSHCSGCTACYTACPKHAITMTPDELGFKYPIINKELCIECGICIKVCSFCNPKLNDNPQRVYAARNLESDEIKSSRSGAIFPELYKTIIKEKGIVYGAAFDESLMVKHKAALLVDECVSFKGSKYVQSELGDTFQGVITNLKEGKKVLFSGTPCQVSGLLSVVPSKLQSSLYTVDIICHGVPSPQLFKDYLFYIENKHHSKVKNFNFRDKSINGWHDHKESASLENGDTLVDTTYTNLFYTNCFFRESCYSCPYASTKRVSDITLGDLWGWERIDKELNGDDLGISLVFANTDKGRMLLNQSKDVLLIKQIGLEQCMQRNLKAPTPMPSFRGEFLKVYNIDGFAKLMKYIFHPSFVERLVRKIKRTIQNNGRNR